MAYYHYVLGADHYRRGMYHEAQTSFEQALLIRPEDPALLYNLAMVLLKRGRKMESLHFLERYCKYEQDPREVQQVQAQMRMLAKANERPRVSPRTEAAVSSNLVRKALLSSVPVT